MVASLAGVVVQDVSLVDAMADPPDVTVLGLQALVLVVAVALAALALRGVRRGWLH